MSVVLAGAAGLAAWAALGAIGLTDGVATAAGVPGAVRVGMLASPLWGVAVAVVAAAWFLRRPHAATTIGLAALTILPWLPIDVPAPALVWAGPLAAMLWAFWIVAAALASGLRVPAWLRPWTHDPLRATRLAFVVSTLAYGSGLWLAAPTVPGGDEPHYLMIARSLIADGDLRIENNHSQREYLPFFEGELKPDYLRRGVDGAIYSIHAPGLPVLVAPALALFGHRGAMLFLALLSALGASLAWRLAYETSGDVGAAWFGWAATALTAPFFLHAFTVYPDACASVLLVFGLLGFVRATGLTSGRACGYGAALACLPWLHTRYALLAAALGGAIVVRLAQRRRVLEAAAFLAVPIVSACAWFAFFQSIYGTPNPAAPYGGYTQSALAQVLPGLTGLLVDQQFGLLTTAPVLVWALVGLALMWFVHRKQGGAADIRPLAATLFLIIAPYAAATAAYRMWWGGFSAPARFLVPLVLPLAAPAAVLWARARSSATRSMAAWALIWSIGLTWMLVAIDGGAMAYATRTPAAAWARWLSPLVDVARGLPSVHRGPLSVTLLQTAAWSAIALLTWAALVGAERRWKPPVDRLAGVRTPLALALALMVGLAAAWAIEGVDPLRRAASQSALVERASERRPWVGLAFEPGPWPLLIPHRVSAGDALTMLRLTSETAAGRGQPELVLPFLPAGRYRLQMTPNGDSPARALIYVGRSATPVLTRDLGDSPPADARAARVAEFTLPVHVVGLTVRSERGAPALGDVAVQALTLTWSGSMPDGVAAQAASYGDVAVYFVGEGIFPEAAGFWVRPGMTATAVVVHPAASAPLELRMRNAPVANRVSIESGTLADASDLAPGGERLVTLPPPGPSRTTVLRIRAERGVRPAELEPGNRDMRLLGVWVEVRNKD